MSIRLLFSSSKKSRDAFQKTLGAVQEDTDPFFDELLLSLQPANMQPAGTGARAPGTILPLFCSRPTSQRYFDRCYFQDYKLNEARWERMQSGRTCSASAEFRIFGYRLRALQAFVQNQPIRSLRELLNERRDKVEVIKFLVNYRINIAVGFVGLSGLGIGLGQLIIK